MADGTLPQADPALLTSLSPGEVRAKVFMHGGSQAVRLPKAFRFEGGEVTVRRDGQAVVLEPLKSRGPPTREAVEAFYARMDALRGDHEIVSAPRDDAPWRDPPRW